MCGQDLEAEAPRVFGDDFPWHLGVFDVHNHIGELAPLADRIPRMRSRGVAIMATRTQDQPLVAKMAESYGLKEAGQLSAADTTTVVPGFGRHPWFSHELYDDAVESPTFSPPETDAGLEKAKLAHYHAVLTPPPDDLAFVADLPTPEPLSEFISTTRDRLRSHPLAIVGEIGLDRPFRLAQQWEPGAKAARALAHPDRTPGGRGRRPLSRHNVGMAHQKVVLLAQLRLAGEMGRAVSVHGVQVHGVLFDLLVGCWKGHERKGKTSRRRKQQLERDGPSAVTTERASSAEGREEEALPYPPRICLHSFSGKAEAVRQYLNPRFPATIFFSFSKSNNMRDEAGRAKMRDALGTVPDDRVLVESDIHEAGDRMDGDLEDTYRAVCAFKGWTLEEGVERIARNYRRFIFGEDGEAS
ncbi:unnamed protein product [Clonostachys chloroleuca]|uniref:Cut9-interacting protein scn1 n=1 Tax=Clonostachys chloroleuca TaxID=1926264 RepID=A0AA35LYP6_9HYPO|nr:unnamed protein product [Clonostachys chloroleuca]